MYIYIAESLIEVFLQFLVTIGLFLGGARATGAPPIQHVPLGT